ncbi:hypothetical protein BDZ91DRAFT_93975 [Kalaharituber pfeilii]|nr:hypothetical protein BDZ91DRAFT_93975 [Kalaharituber pfeilii]
MPPFPHHESYEENETRWKGISAAIIIETATPTSSDITAFNDEWEQNSRSERTEHAMWGIFAAFCAVVFIWTGYYLFCQYRKQKLAEQTRGHHSNGGGVDPFSRFSAAIEMPILMHIEHAPPLPAQSTENARVVTTSTSTTTAVNAGHGDTTSTSAACTTSSDNNNKDLNGTRRGSTQASFADQPRNGTSPDQIRNVADHTAVRIEEIPRTILGGGGGGGGGDGRVVAIGNPEDGVMERGAGTLSVTKTKRKVRKAWRTFNAVFWR